LDLLNGDLRKGGIDSSDCSVDLEIPRVIERSCHFKNMNLKDLDIPRFAASQIEWNDQKCSVQDFTTAFPADIMTNVSYRRQFIESVGIVFLRPTIESGWYNENNQLSFPLCEIVDFSDKAPSLPPRLHS
jgi:hypothetical protein